MRTEWDATPPVRRAACGHAKSADMGRPQREVYPHSEVRDDDAGYNPEEAVDIPGEGRWYCVRIR
jgi:hypothetical protein